MIGNFSAIYAHKESLKERSFLSPRLFNELSVSSNNKRKELALASFLSSCTVMNIRGVTCKIAPDVISPLENQPINTGGIAIKFKCTNL